MTGASNWYLLSACGFAPPNTSSSINLFLLLTNWLLYKQARVSTFILSCVVSPCCPTESSVLQSPVFTKQPGSIVYPVETLERNREVVFSCEAQGSPPPIYRWVRSVLSLTILVRVNTFTIPVICWETLDVCKSSDITQRVHTFFFN